MTLLDLLRMLCAGWRLMFGGLVVGFTLAGGYLAMTPEKYEASLLVEVGEVAQIIWTNEKSPVVSVKQVESPGRVIERLQSPVFKKAVLESLGWNGGARESIFRSSLLTTQRNNDVEIRLRGFAPDEARRAAEATLSVLAGAHRVLIEAVVAKNEKELAATLSEIADTQALLGRLERIGKEIPPGSRQEILTWLQITQDQKVRLLALRRMESATREALNSKLTGLTTAIEPVVVSASPVHPKARQVWLLALIGGLLLGVLSVTLRSLVNMK